MPIINSDVSKGYNYISKICEYLENSKHSWFLNKKFDNASSLISFYLEKDYRLLFCLYAKEKVFLRYQTTSDSTSVPYSRIHISIEINLDNIEILKNIELMDEKIDITIATCLNVEKIVTNMLSIAFGNIFSPNYAFIVYLDIIINEDHIPDIEMISIKREKDKRETFISVLGFDGTDFHLKSHKQTKEPNQTK